MRFVRSNLVLVGFAAIMLPVTARAQAQAPAGYAPAPASYGPAPTTMMGADGKAVVVQPVTAQMAAQPAAPAPHKHRFRTVCASCAKKQGMMAPGERIVGCAHSSNGVCPACRTLLEMPGAITVGAPAPAGGEAPGRAVVSQMPSASPMPGGNPYATQSNATVAVYDPSMSPEPAPIGVMQTNYSQPGAMPAAPSSIPTARSLQPGHALAESGGNPAPFMHKPTSSKNPHVIGHLLGFYGIGNEWRDQRAQKKSEAHSSIPYNTDGTTVNELPASVVYGKP